MLGQYTTSPVYVFFNFTTLELYYKNNVVRLGVKELELLKLLIENYPKTVTKDEIYFSLWSYDEISESSIKNETLLLKLEINSVLGFLIKCILSSK